MVLMGSGQRPFSRGKTQGSFLIHRLTDSTYQIQRLKVECTKLNDVFRSQVFWWIWELLCLPYIKLYN